MGSLTTWGLLGMVLGGAVGGVISDRIGRKKTLVIAVIFYGLFTLPQAFANDIVFFAVFRLIAGFGVGSCIPVVTTVFSESMPSKQRGVFVTFGMAFMVVGWVLAGLDCQPHLQHAHAHHPGPVQRGDLCACRRRHGHHVRQLAPVLPHWRSAGSFTASC